MRHPRPTAVGIPAGLVGDAPNRSRGGPVRHLPDQQHTFQFSAGRAPEADEAIRTSGGYRPNSACDRSRSTVATVIVR
jgi:hypothetical protein